MAGYSYAPQQYYYTTPEVQHANISYVSNHYFSSTTNFHVDVASHNSGIHIALASNYSDGFNYAVYNSENYMQQPMPNNMHNLNFDATNNIHTYFHTSAAEQVHMLMNNYQGQTNMVSSANLYETSCANHSNTIQQGVSYAYSSVASSQYLIPSQSMPMNEKIGHTDFSYPVNYSQPLYDAQHISRVEAASSNSAPHASANTHIPAPNVSNTYSRINENSRSIHTPPHVNSSCVSSYASPHNFGTTHSPLLKVHASDFANKAAPNSVSTILQKPNIFWDAKIAEMKKDVFKRFSKDKKSEDKLNKFAETQVRLYKSCFQEIE
jgi:hypothetical protein